MNVSSVRTSASMRSLTLTTLLAVAACGPGATGGDAGRDGGSGDGGGGGACVANAVVCEANRATQCDANGRPTTSMVCSGETAACVDRVGCRPCRGGTRSCSAAGIPQVCRADHSGYDPQPACTGAGESCVDGLCLSPCAEAAMRRSYLGCEYWPVTLRNTCLAELGGDFPFAIAVANGNNQIVTVRIEGGALTSPLERTVRSGQLEVIELPWVPEVAQLRMRGAPSVLRTGGAYHVTTTAPVTVYQFNPLNFEQPGTGGAMSQYSYSNDASLLLPTSVLGTRYTALTPSGIDIRVGMTMPWASPGTLTVVGTQATPTMVTVNQSTALTPGAGITAGAAGATQTFSLGRGDVLQLAGGGMGSDLTGTTVQSSAPVAVYTGHGCAFVPSDRLAADHLEEQLFPDTAWGRRYAVTRFMDRPEGPSRVRILALQEGTTLTFDPPEARPAAYTGPLAARTPLEFESTRDFVVTSDKPVLVLQMMYGGGQEVPEGDPAMVYEVPVEQYRDEYLFLAPQTYTHNYVNIVGPAGSTPRLDGMPVPSTSGPRPMGSSGLGVWTIELTPGVHRVGMAGAEATFGIKVYGTALFTSYAYPGGLDLRVITPG